MYTLTDMHTKIIIIDTNILRLTDNTHRHRDMQTHSIHRQRYVHILSTYRQYYAYIPRDIEVRVNSDTHTYVRI